MKTFDELWLRLNASFDWGKVHKTMVFLEWKWRFEGVPSIEEIKVASKDLLQQCYNEVTLSDSVNKSSIGSGGLYANYSVFNTNGTWHNELTLEFKLESFSVW